MQEEQKGQEVPEQNGLVGEVEGQSALEKEKATAEGEELVREEQRRRSGCLRGCLTPIAVIFLIFLVLFMIGYSKRDAIRSGLLRRIIANTENHVLGELPEGIDGEAIKAVFENVRAAMTEGRIDVEALTDAIEKYQDATRKRPTLDQKKQEINELMAELNVAIIVRDE